MITYLFPTEIAKFIAGEVYLSPTYFAIGDGTTAETRSDTALVSELSRKALTLSTEDVVFKQLVELNSTETALYNKYITETGTFSGLVAGTLFDRSVSCGSIIFDAATELKITKFSALDNTPLSSNNYFMDDGINEIILSLTGAGDEPSHIAWSSDLILEKCDAIGIGPNDWTDDSSAASTPTLNTTNYQEGTGSINLGKDGAGAATFYYKKALASSIDCSLVTTFYIELDIENSVDLAKFKSTGCLKIKVGSSSSDYKMMTIDKSSLIVGWQTISCPVSSMTTVGTPVMTAIDYLEILMETTNATDTITHGNIIMDYWRGYFILDANDTSLHNENYREVLNTPTRTSDTVKFIGTMDTSEGNTYNYKFSGVFNANSSGDLYFALQSFDEKKSGTIQITTSVEITVNIYG